LVADDRNYKEDLRVFESPYDELVSCPQLSRSTSLKDQYHTDDPDRDASQTIWATTVSRETMTASASASAEPDNQGEEIADDTNQEPHQESHDDL